MVDSRRSGFEPGKREFWETQAEAIASAEQIERTLHNEGASSFVELTPAQRRDAAEALALIGESGSLLDAARCFVAERARLAALAKVPTVEVCLNAYLSAKRAEAELAPTTLYEIESKARIIRAEFQHLKITELDEASVREWLRKLHHRPRGKKNILTKLTQFLNFCRRELKAISVNPTEEISVPVKNGSVEILSVAEAARLLKGAQSSRYPASVVPYLAVQLFGGLRPGEAAELRWEFIHFETKQLEVKAATSKTREDRFVTLEARLAAWLLAYRKSEGSIIGPFFVDALRAVKQAAGFGKTRPWPKDVLRHCYGSYWLAIHKDRAQLAELMGNSIDIIKRHYRRAIPEQVAAEFWRLSPTSAKGSKIVNLVV
jgi:integrase